MKHKERKFIEIEIPQSLGLCQSKILKVELNASGEPPPLLAFDFDNTLYDGHLTYYEAAREIVMMYGDDISQVPSIKEFKAGVHPNLHKWGVPDYVPYDAAWEIFSNLISKIESRSPCRLFNCIPKQLQEMAKRFHIIIVTLNSIHPVSSMIRRETGLNIDVVVVEDKT